MRTATTKIMAACGSIVMMSGAALAVGQGTANAEPAVHQVKYTLSSQGPGDFNLYYSFNAPASLEAYHATPDAFVKSDKVNIGPDSPWVLETTLADSQWAFLSASGAAHAMQADPNIRCEIAVDGVVVADHARPFTTQCQLRPWN